MHERNVHRVTVFAGMCVTGLEYKTMFLGFLGFFWGVF